MFVYKNIKYWITNNPAKEKGREFLIAIEGDKFFRDKIYKSENEAKNSAEKLITEKL